jgi:hypothetical protein
MTKWAAMRLVRGAGVVAAPEDRNSGRTPRHLDQGRGDPVALAMLRIDSRTS